jgi:peptide/nickel transport system substrate-binding protein
MNTGGNARVASEFKALGYAIPTYATGTAVLLPDTANATSPWANIKVRMAADYSIDKEAIAKAFGYTFKQAAYQLPSPGSKAYVPTITGRKYDVAKAKQLLAEAGFPNGFKTKIVAQSTANRDVVVAIQSALGQVGIQADLDFPEPAKYVTYQQGTWENALIYATLGQSPNFNQAPIGHALSVPRAQYKSVKLSDKWTALYNATMRAPAVDFTLQQACVQDIYDDCSLITIVYEPSMWVARDKLQDYGLGTERGAEWTSAETWLSK